MCGGPRPWLQSRPPGSCWDPTPEILILLMRGGAWAYVFKTVNSDDSAVQQWGAGSRTAGPDLSVGGLDTQRLPGRGDVTSHRAPAFSCTKTRDRCASGSQRSRNLRMQSLCFRRGACSRGRQGGQYWLQAWVLGPPWAVGPWSGHRILHFLSSPGSRQVLRELQGFKKTMLWKRMSEQRCETMVGEA